MPAGPVFDAHFHVFDHAMPGDRGFVPEPFRAADYRARTAALGVVGGAVVAGSMEGTYPAPLLAAARALGPGFVVVAQADPALDEAGLAALAARGVRGLRYNLWRGVWASPAAVAEHAARAAAAAGLHAQVYADAAALAPAAKRWVVCRRGWSSTTSA